MKERVNVSSRPIGDGVKSLFLDYRVQGKRKRENLKLYLYPERTAADRARNAETMRVAKAARDKREFELEQMEAGVEVKARPRLLTFSEYFETFKAQSTSDSVKDHICHAMRGFWSTILQDMDRRWFVDYVRKMRTEKKKDNTIRNYMTIIKSVLIMAQKDGVIQEVPPIADVMPKFQEVIRVFLTIEELRALSVTECRRPETKRAFLFCCFTGLRISDVKKLRQTDIVDGFIVLRQTKTREPVRIPLNASATAMLEDGGLPFKLGNETTIRTDLRRWCRDAGVNKYISFHTSRHTFATLALSYGADLYTVSKLLGHTDVKTTQIYAKVVDESKKKAVESIPGLDIGR